MLGIAHNTGVIKAVCGRVVGAFRWLARVGAQLPDVADRHLCFQQGRFSDCRVVPVGHPAVV